MVIEINEIEIGYMYRTSTNQERVVLGCDSDGKIVYAARGGNAKNKFDTRYSCNHEKFAGACEQKLQKIKPDILEKIINDCNAQKIIVTGSSCL